MAGGGGGADRNRWLVSYADFITLMMVFFVVLYASARLDAQRFARVAASLRRGFGTQVAPLPGDGSGPVPGGAPGGAVPAPLSGEGGAGLPEFAATLAARGGVPENEPPPEPPPTPSAPEREAEKAPAQPERPGKEEPPPPPRESPAPAPQAPHTEAAPPPAGRAPEPPPPPAPPAPAEAPPGPRGGDTGPGDP